VQELGVRVLPVVLVVVLIVVSDLRKLVVREVDLRSGGSRARRTARSRAGGSDSGRPRALSPHELTNCMAPTPPNMQWLMASPSTKLPHLNLVT